MFVSSGNKRSIISAVMSNLHLSEQVVSVVARVVEKELKEICSDEYSSIEV